MRKISFLLLVTLLASCGKTKFSDLSYKGGLDSIFNGQSPYTGEVWSQDGKSLKFTVQDGKIVGQEFYTEKGWLMADVDSNKVEVFYNEDGKTITRQDSKELYTREWNFMQEQYSQLWKIIISSSVDE